MNNDFFDFGDIELNDKQVEKKVNPILFSNSNNPEIYFICDKIISEYTINLFYKNILQKMKYDITFQIIYCFKYKVDIDKETRVQKGNFYKNNHIDFSKYIKENSKIITIGNGAIYALTDGNTDLNVEGFYDFIFNKTYFYQSQLKSYIFPIDEFFLWNGKDNFENFYMSKQIKSCINFKFQNVRQKSLTKILVEDTNKFLNDNMNKNIVAWDIETSGLNYMEDEIGCITMSFDGKIGYYLRWKDIDKQLLNKFFENKYQILANGKFDIRFLRYQGINNVKVDFDTYNCGHVLNEMRSNSLKTHAWLYTDYGGYELKLDEYKDRYKIKNYLQIPESILFEYATMDSIICFQVYEKMKKQLDDISNNEKIYNKNDEWKLNDYFYKIVIPSIETYTQIEMNGMLINKDKLRMISNEIKQKINDVKEKLCIYFNLPLNENSFKLLNSNEQVGKWLEEKKWKQLTRTEKGNYNVDDDCLGQWLKLGYKEAQLLLDLHELNTLFNNFIGDEKKNNGMWQYIRKDGRVHCNYGVMIAGSGRNLCYQPNLQNQPKQGQYAKLLRSVFTCDKDYYISARDAAAFQLRIGAALSNDTFMRKAFCKLGGDLHSLTAVSYLKRNITLEEFIKNKKNEELKKFRFKAKAINFGFLFGEAGIAFSDTIRNEWTIEEVENYIKENKLEKNIDLLYQRREEHNLKKEEYNFFKFWAVANHIRKKHFEIYNGLSEWHKKTIKFAEENGYVKSSYGCIRRIPQLLYVGRDSNMGRVKNWKNISLNSPVQSFESSLINMTMNYVNNEIKKRNLKSKLLCNVHDEICSMDYKEEVEIIDKLMKEFFEKERVVNNGIPMKLECEIADPNNKENPTYWGFGEEV